MTESEFWNSSISFFAKKLKGFEDLEFDRAKVIWNATRANAMWILAPHAKKGLKATDLTTFPWEKIVKTRDQWIGENKAIFATCKKIAEA